MPNQTHLCSTGQTENIFVTWLDMQLALAVVIFSYPLLL